MYRLSIVVLIMSYLLGYFVTFVRRQGGRRDVQASFLRDSRSANRASNPHRCSFLNWSHFSSRPHRHSTGADSLNPHSFECSTDTICAPAAQGCEDTRSAAGLR